MLDLSILFLQAFLGITSPTPDQIKAVTYDQQQQAATYYQTTSSTTTESGYMTGTPVDPNELN